MKFIREIIAEKTNMASSHSNPEAEIADMPAPPESEPLELDPVHRVASGGMSLNRADQFMYRDQGDTEEPTPDDEPDALDDDQNDMVSMDGPKVSLEQPEAEFQEPPEDEELSELFADIWDEQEEPTVIPQEEERFAAIPETPEPASNAKALMRTMYPENDAYPDMQDSLDDSEATVEQVEIVEPVEEEIPANSPYLGIRRRQAASQTEPEATPEPAIASEPAPTSEDTMPEIAPEPIAVPAPAAGRGRRQAGRVKTRLLGFGNEHNRDSDLFAKGGNAEPAIQTMYPVGWMVVISGPGRGTAFSLQNGVSQIGRGEGQAVRLDFGDNSISRENHAAVAYDPEQQEFFLGHGGKANLVRLNGKPVLSTEPLQNGALIRIGETTLRFVALCGTDFDWDKSQDDEG